MKKLSAKQITKARAALLAEITERDTVTFTKSENYAYWFVSYDLDQEGLIVREPIGKFLGHIIFCCSLPTKDYIA